MQLMAKSACYVRVSTDNQLENYSIKEQTDRLKAYCRAKDIQIAKIYTDGGYSGGNLNRPALNQMLEDIGRGDIDLVVVYKLDRLSRSQKDTLTLIEDRFLAHGVDFVSINENFDTSTPLGRAMIGILSVFAQLEKDQITERFTMGRIGRARNGYFHGGAYAPTGYDYMDGRLVVNEYEALQVRELYDRFLKGHPVHACWQYMKGKYTTKYGGWKSEALVRNILQNEVYTGKVKFKGVAYPGNHQPIISEETFSQAQELFKASRASPDGGTRPPFRAGTLLSGLVYCGRCGARYHGEHGNYSCYSRTKGDKRYVKDPGCKNKKWRIEELDTLVADCISKLTFSDLKPPHLKSNPQSGHRKRLAEIEREAGRLLDLYQIGSIPIEAISQKMDTLAKEKAALREDAQEGLPAEHGEETRKAGDSFLSLISSGSLREKRACLALLVDRIILDGDEVNIVLRDT